MTDEQNFFDQPVRNHLKTYDNIQKFPTGQEDGYTTGCFLDYNYFKKHYKLIAIDLSKQQVLNAHPKAIEQINFTGNLGRQGNAITTVFSIIEEAKGTVLDFSQETAKVL